MRDVIDFLNAYLIYILLISSLAIVLISFLSFTVHSRIIYRRYKMKQYVQCQKLAIRYIKCISPFTDRTKETLLLYVIASSLAMNDHDAFLHHLAMMHRTEPRYLANRLSWQIIYFLDCGDIGNALALYPQLLGVVDPTSSGIIDLVRSICEYYSGNGSDLVVERIIHHPSIDHPSVNRVFDRLIRTISANRCSEQTQ